jgi:anti-anti-sigma factor
MVDLSVGIARSYAAQEARRAVLDDRDGQEHRVPVAARRLVALDRIPSARLPAVDVRTSAVSVSRESTLSDAGTPQKDPPRVDVELWPPRAPCFAAIVRLVGEHDMATSEAVLAAFGPIAGDLLVDLSACTFLDSTVIRVVLAAFQEQQRLGRRLELVVPPANATMTRTVEISGIRDVLTVHESAEIARAGDV